MKVKYEGLSGFRCISFEDAATSATRSYEDGALEQVREEVRLLTKLVGRLIEHIAETDPQNADRLVKTVLGGTLERDQ